MDTVIAALDNLLLFLSSEEVTRSFFNNRFYTILSVIILMHVKNAAYRGMWSSALVNIPGTLLHEMMHFLVGAFLNARPCNFTVFPKKDPLSGDYVMGSVGFRNITFYNAVPAALAPLLLLPVGFYLNRYFLPYIPQTILGYVFYILLQTVIIENAMPSQADFRIAGMYLSGLLLYGILLICLLLML